ncbi:Sulfatase [Pseudomonas syringae pv. maculicola]|nr:Sulfatase [Pseudomonas syringae pv. maculicola]
MASQSSDPLVARAIAYYQSASHGFKHQLLMWADRLQAPRSDAGKIAEL